MSRPLDGASRAPVRLCRTRRRRMTGDPGGSPDPLCAARGPIFRKSAGHSSCRISVPDAQYKEKTFFLSAIVPLFGRVSGCVPSCGEGQHPCPSRRFRASLGPLFRQCRDCLFPPPWTLSEGREEERRAIERAKARHPQSKIDTLYKEKGLPRRQSFLNFLITVTFPTGYFFFL